MGLEIEDSPEYWTKLVECNALQVAVHFENCTALLRIAVHLLPKM